MPGGGRTSLGGGARRVGETAMQTEFLLGAASPAQFPAPGLPEIAFLGRSNVGKSSLLNRLTATKDLAFISSKPGCTQQLNFFRVDKKYTFVDLPGYGYARVSKTERAGWRKLIESYLLERDNLSLCLLLIDSRHGWMEMDLELSRWLEYHKRPYQVVATKFDKIKKQSEIHHALATLKAPEASMGLVPFSAVTGQGVREIWQTIKTISTRS